MPRTILKTVALALLACACALAIPAIAAADDYCVEQAVTCTNSNAFDEAGLVSAVTAANTHPGLDRVLISAGTISIDTASSVSVTATSTLDIVGAGAGQTIIERDGGTGAVLNIQFFDSASTVSDLTVRQTGASYGNITVLNVGYGTARRVEAKDLSNTVVSGYALGLYGDAHLDQSTVTTTSPNVTGLNATSGGVKVSHSVFEAGAGSLSDGINASGTGSTYNIDHSTFRGWYYAIALDSGTVNVSDSLIDLGNKSWARGVSAANDNLGNSPLALNATRLTVVGTGVNQDGILGQADNGTESFTGNIEDTLMLVTGTGAHDFRCVQAGALSATLNTTSSAFNIANGVREGTCAGSIASPIDTSVSPPEFVNAAGGDYRPKYGSPLIDGGSTSPSLTSADTDLAGAARLVDGDVDGNATVDVGAYEYQRIPPLVSAAASSLSPAIGENVAFTASATDAENEPVTFAWAFDDGTAASGGSVSHAFATSGVHSATVTATDTSGANAVATIALDVHAVVASPPSLVLTKKPSRAFRQKHKDFAFSPKARQPYVGLTASDAGTVRFTLERRTTGVKRSGKCRAGSGRPRCTRFVKVKGSMTLMAPNGDLRLTFGGRFRGRKLAAGRYRLTLVPSGGFTAGTRTRVNIVLK